MPEATDTNPSEETRPRGKLAHVRTFLSPNKAYASDRPPRLRRRAMLFMLGPLAVLLTWVFAFFPGAVERFYADSMGPAITRGLSALSGLTTVNLTGGVDAALIVWMLWPAPRAIYHVIRRRRRVSNAVLCGLGRFAATCGVLGAVFYASWGVNYARAGLIERMGWNDPFANPAVMPSMEAVEDEIAGLCAQLIDETNGAYEAATGSPDLGRPSGEDVTWARMNASIDAGYRRVQGQLGLTPSFAEGRGPAKAFYSGELISTLGIAGFYNPWTAEANINPFVPRCQMPSIVGHEKAHQRGISSEDEANFFGYLACVACDDEYMRYSGLLFAQRQLLMVLLQLDPERGEFLVKKRLPGVQRDVTDMKAFWASYEGPARTASLAVNNAYLKANRVKGGLQSYGLSAKLLVIYARENGGSCVPTRTANKGIGRALSGSDAAAGS